MNIYDFEDYRKYLKEWIKTQPGNGRGILKKWSEEVGVHSTLLSQIMAEKKEMGLDLAEKISCSIGHSEAEFDYFLLLVLLSKAGTLSFKNQLKRKIHAEKNKALSIGERLRVSTELNEESQSIFYSSWLYSGVRNLTAVPEFSSIEAIANRLSLPRPYIQEIVEFLLKNGLCLHENKKLKPGTQRTHVKAESPHVLQHHNNWRLQALQKMPLRKSEDLFFTFPMSLAKKDAEKIRRMLPSIIEDIHKIVGPSESQTVRCLNIDFFEY